MSEISLRDYFGKLEQLLNTNAADEVIRHCRHILQYYPKNVAAYRFLGRALLVNGRWDEAIAALRRVLSVIPDDYAAHLGLSEVYDHKQKADDAIWHLERAFEQNPNNSQLLDGIRALYRRYRDVDQAKVQLTAAAVARQALRNQQFEHAIDTLRDALERQPDRIDLNLLLALALWDSGDHVEAAETALDVLQVLPDCLEANRILTMLWLEEDRPSDAQRYLNRVEAIDPYIAVEVAQGQATSDDAFHLEELDYVRSAQSELTVNRPDWLKDITAEAPAVDAGGDDWSNFASSMLASSANAQAQADEEKPSVDLFGDDATSLTEIPTASPLAFVDDEIPAEFAALPPEFEALDDAPTLTPTPTASQTSDPNDPMAWLHGSGVEMLDEELPPFQAAHESLAEEASDSLAWLQNDDSPMEDEGVSARPIPDSEAFSWMQNYDVEVSEDFSPSPPDNELEPEAEEEMPSWLKDEGFLDEALGIEQLTGNDSTVEPDWLNTSASKKETAALPEQTPPEMRPTTPMRDSALGGEGLLVDTDWLKDVSQDEPQPVPGPRRGLTAMLGEANFDWMQEKPVENDLNSDEVMDEWLAQFRGAESRAEAPPVEQDPAWLTELDTTMTDEPNQPEASEEMPEWLSEVGDSDTAKPSDSEEALSWMQDEPEPAPADMPDWLSDLQPAASSSSDTGEDEQPESSDEFDWSATEVAVEEPEPSDMPDWMTELEPTSTYETPSAATFEHEPSIEESEFEWLPEDGIVPQKPTAEEEAEFAWLDESPIEAEAEFASAVGESQDESQFDAEPISSVESQAWSGEPEVELDLDPEDMPVEVPDWLSELKPQPQAEFETEAEPVAAHNDDDSWLDEKQPEPEVELELDVEDLPVDVPDWLSDLQPQSQIETEMEAEPVVTLDDDSWLDEETVTEAEADEQPAAAEVADWLSDLKIKPQSEDDVAVEPLATLEADDNSWLDQEPVVEGEADEQPVAADVPDWLSDLQPQPQAEFETEAEPVAALENDDDSWLDEEPVAQEASDEEVVAAEVPDWLSDLQPQQQTEADLEPEPVAALDDDSWLDEADANAEPVAAPEAITGESSDFGWLDEVEARDAEAPVEEERDMTFQPIRKIETDELDALPSRSLMEEADDEDDYWLNDEQAEIETVNGEQPSEDDINEFEGLTVFPSDEMDMMRDENFEPIPASNAPDWLNAMVPGLDVDFEALEDEPLETEFEGETAIHQPAHSREFDWVEEIVEEESRQPETTATVAEPAQPRYIFSRPPSWMNEPIGQIEEDDDLPDWPSDVPDWLR